MQTFIAAIGFILTAYYADGAKAVRLYGKGKTPLVTLHFGAAREPVLFRADAATGGHWDFLVASIAV